jgi:alkylresorcinol/alkylpyrone synthase
MPPFPRLAAIASAVPPYALDQDAVVARLESLFGRSPALDRLMPVFAHSGVARRYLAAPLEWYDEPHGWGERNRRYLAAAADLLERVAGRLLDRAGIAAEALGGIVTVSTTGIATPSLGAVLSERMRLPRTVKRLPIFGLGCAGGALGLARAAALAAAEPDKPVLFLVVELCSLAFRHGDNAKSHIVATALFGDGAAGAILCCGGNGPAIAASGEYQWPGSLDVMGWDVGDDGLKAVFSRDIPHLVATRLGGVASDFLAGHGLGLGDIDRFVCHPGGAKVVDACEDAFGLARGSLAEARRVLREFGNMSAASVLFVLERAMAAPWRRALLTALGPGFSAGFLVLERR